MAKAKVKSTVDVDGTPLVPANDAEVLYVTLGVTRGVLADLANLIADDYDNLPNEFQTAFAKAVKAFIPEQNNNDSTY